MSKQKYKEAESLLVDYVTGKLDAQMERRKLVLKYPPKPKEELGVKVQTTKRSDQLENEVINYLEDSTYNRLKSDRDMVKQFLTYIVGYDNDTYQILNLFYRDGKSWVHIAEKVNIAQSSCRDRRTKAIKELVSWLNVS